jgi:unsaturated rhamnogalacturonyl hydrolase
MIRSIWICILVTGIALLTAACERLPDRQVKRIVFTISHSYGFPEDPLPVILDLGEIEELYGLADFEKLKLIDLNDNSEQYFRYLDENGDQEADGIIFTFHPLSKEPLRPFAFTGSNEGDGIEMIGGEGQENSLSIEYLFPAAEAAGGSAVDWSEVLAGSVMEKYPDACDLEIFAPGRWTYTNGFFTNALCEMYRLTSRAEYLDYVRNWVDCFVEEDGWIRDYVQEKYRLDDILPGRSLLYLCEYGGNNKYKKAADTLIYHLQQQPRTSEGGYWHKQIYPHQMWLDGIYMGDVFAAQYASLYDVPSLYDEAIRQVDLIFSHTYDPEFGLMYHGWDESINQVWSDPETGASPEFWGRGMGWFMMALADLLDYIPPEHPGYSRITEILEKTAAGVAKVQDTSNGLWYQVLDKANEQGNWIESSCSAMFAYAFVKGARLGYLDMEYYEKGQTAFEGLLRDYCYLDQGGRFYLTGTVKVGTLNFKNSDGSYAYYTGVDRRVNDFKGLSALLYLAMELKQ